MKEHLETAARLEGGWIVDHLEDEGPPGAHLDLPDVESEAEEGFEKRAFAIGLATQGDDLRDGEFLPEGDGGGLEAVVGLESGLEISRRGGGGIHRVGQRCSSRSGGVGLSVWSLHGGRARH